MSFQQKKGKSVYAFQKKKGKSVYANVLMYMYVNAMSQKIPALLYTFLQDLYYFFFEMKDLYYLSYLV